MRKWYRIASRALISAVLTTLICIFFIERQYPYRGRLVSSAPFNYKDQRDYFDLDQDEKTEMIRSVLKVRDLTELLIYEWDGDLIDQANVRGSLLRRCRLFEGDYNGDGLSELYLFTHVGDSLWLNVVDPNAGGRQLIARKMIPGTRMMNGEASYTITGGQMGDVNGDGSLDFYFSVIAGFTRSPRNVYCYDIVNDSLYRSPTAGSGPRSFLRSDDLDNDGTPEYWGRVSAFGNYSDIKVPYSDMSSWLMVFTHDLEFEFEPLEFPAFGSVVDAQVMETDGMKKLVVVKTYKGNLDSIHNELLLVSLSGKIEGRQLLPDQFQGIKPVFYVRNQEVFIYDLNGKLYAYDRNLELQNILERDWFRAVHTGRFRYPGNDEVLYYITSDGALSLTDMDHKMLARLDLKVPPSGLIHIKSISTDIIKNGIHLRTNSNEQTIAIEINPRRYFEYFYGFAIFLSILAFIYLVQVFQIRQEQKRMENEKRLRTLQLQSLKSQMNPHFIFNALNSISAMYMQGNNRKANNFLTSFSRMIRDVVDSSERVVVTLREEIDFVRNYLELEKIRYGENFSFSFDISNDCMEIELPSMCIHAFVENSVKHAFHNKQKPMHVVVNAHRKGKLVKVEIKDNGIGFGNAENPLGRTGKGMKIVSEIISNYSKASGRKIFYIYRNIGSEDNTTEGSLVELSIEA